MRRIKSGKVDRDGYRVVYSGHSTQDRTGAGMCMKNILNIPEIIQEKVKKAAD